jgi:hypothetical protein
MITGTGKLSRRIDSSNPPESMPSAAAASPELKTLRSKPALNTRELPAMTTALTSPSAAAFSARSSAALTFSCIAGDSALTLPSSSVIVATDSVCS